MKEDARTWRVSELGVSTRAEYDEVIESSKGCNEVWTVCRRGRSAGVRSLPSECRRK